MVIDMKNRITRLLSFALILAISLSLAGCGKGGDTEPTEIVGTNVEVGEVLRRDIFTTASYTGELTTNERASVTSKVSAKVTAINVEVGDYVEKGTLLLVLDASDYEYQLRQAQASYNQARAGYTQAQAGYKQAQAGVNSADVSYNNVKNGASEQSLVQLEQAVSAATIAYNDAKSNFDRQEQLYEMGAISQVTFESAKSALENARIALESAEKNYDLAKNVLLPGNEESAKSGVDTAKAGLETAGASMNSASAAMQAASLAEAQARENIAATRITAPISGYISSKSVVLGQFASPGYELFSISAASNLEAQIQVTESVVPYVKFGGEAKIDITAANIHGLSGTVTVVNPVKNAQTGMYTVRVSVPNEDDTLKIGMFADITLITDESAESALSIPSDSILQEGDTYYVYVVKGNEAEKKVITIGVTDGSFTQVTAGLEEGEKVVTLGKEYLSETNNIVNVVE